MLGITVSGNALAERSIMKVFEFQPEGVSGGRVRAWLHINEGNEMPQQMHPAVVICPGGGYAMVSEREAEPVAREYFAAGYNTYILNYAINEDAKGFQPLCQLAAVVAQIRKNTEEWKTEAEKIAVCGFSAGGHLAASLGTLFNEKEFLEVFGREENIRPNAMILSYPVITADEFAHQASIERVSGEAKGTPGYEWFGLNKHVDAQTPPAFLWHTASDPHVPVENSLKMAVALSREKIPFELHIFPEGCHGISVCTQEVGSADEYNARWMKWSIQWLDKLFEHRL